MAQAGLLVFVRFEIVPTEIASLIRRRSTADTAFDAIELFKRHGDRQVARRVLLFTILRFALLSSLLVFNWAHCKDVSPGGPHECGSELVSRWICKGYSRMWENEWQGIVYCLFPLHSRCSEQTSDREALIRAHHSRWRYFSRWIIFISLILLSS